MVEEKQEGGVFPPGKIGLITNSQFMQHGTPSKSVKM